MSRLSEIMLAALVMLELDARGDEILAAFIAVGILALALTDVVLWWQKRQLKKLTGKDTP